MPTREECVFQYLLIVVQVHLLFSTQDAIQIDGGSKIWVGFLSVKRCTYLQLNTHF